MKRSPMRGAVAAVGKVQLLSVAKLDLPVLTWAHQTYSSGELSDPLQAAKHNRTFL